MDQTTTDILLYLILLVSLSISFELAYGADAPENPPLFLSVVAIVGTITIIGSIVKGVGNQRD